MYSTDSTIIIKRLPEFKSVPVVCSWCGQTFKIRFWKMDQNKTNKSHGVCDDCLLKYKNEHEIEGE